MTLPGTKQNRALSARSRIFYLAGDIMRFVGAVVVTMMMSLVSALMLVLAAHPEGKEDNAEKSIRRQQSHSASGLSVEPC